MDIDRCNSIFELFTAYNFAYSIISSRRVDDKEKYLNLNSTDPSQTDTENIFLNVIDHAFLDHSLYKIRYYASRCNILKVSLTALLELAKNKGHNNEKFLRVLVSLEGIELLIDHIFDLSNEQRKKIVLNVNRMFPFASFTIGLFGITVLILSACEFAQKHLALFFFDLALLVTCTIFFIRFKTQHYAVFSSNAAVLYRNITLSYAVAILCAITILNILILGNLINLNHIDLEILDREGPFKDLLIITNLGIPGIHFLITINYYFFSSNSFNRKVQNSLSTIDFLFHRMMDDYNDSINDLD